MKKMKMVAEFSSIFNDAKYLVNVEISGFLSNKPRANYNFLKGVHKLMDRYDKEERQ